MAATVGLNGDTPQIYNNCILSINGQKDIDIQGYIMGINWSTGTQSAFLQTLNPEASAKTNPINSEPTGTISFAPGAFDTFYTFLNDRFTKFTLTLTYYTTGDLKGPSKNLSIVGATQDGQSGGITPQSPSNNGSFSFKASNITWI